jgi:hypothetical protein
MDILILHSNWYVLLTLFKITCIVNIICLWFKYRVMRSKLRTYLYINLTSTFVLQWLSNILHTIKNIYHFKDALSYCIPSQKKRFDLSCIIKINLLFCSEYFSKKKKKQNKKWHTVETVLISKIKIAERNKIDSTKTQIHDVHFHDTSIKSGGVRLVLWVYTETSHFNLISVKTYTLQYRFEMSFRSSI